MFPFYQLPTVIGLSANPRGDLDRCCRRPVISRNTALISGCCNEGCLNFSISCRIFLTWLCTGTPPPEKLSSSCLCCILLLLFCSIFSDLSFIHNWNLTFPDLTPNLSYQFLGFVWSSMREEKYLYLNGNGERDGLLMNHDCNKDDFYGLFGLWDL